MKQNCMLRWLSVRDMNSKPKRAKLNAAFKKAQRLPSLRPESDARRGASENDTRQPVQSPVSASPTPASGAPSLQFLAE
jgi:hypothetical protein